MWNYTIDIKKKFVLRKEKVYLLSRKGKGEAYDFIDEQSKKESTNFQSYLK